MSNWSLFSLHHFRHSGATNDVVSLPHIYCVTVIEPRLTLLLLGAVIFHIIFSGVASFEFVWYPLRTSWHGQSFLCLITEFVNWSVCIFITCFIEKSLLVQQQLYSIPKWERCVQNIADSGWHQMAFRLRRQDTLDVFVRIRTTWSLRSHSNDSFDPFYRVSMYNNSVSSSIANKIS